MSKSELRNIHASTYADKFREVIPNDDQWYGVTYKEDKPIVQKAMKGLVDAGKYVSPTWK